ncbi:MAG: TylF/MycF/NovP-related O-methyltransferase [Intestinibacter sp.]|uniref:TylF/MycF/NovP-related O-methyltransferase n=1 Tax=Intestinibacter sp. TaxID=1965304 RepID=UPI003F159F30
MEKIMIFGAGQAGTMISCWISSDCDVVGFIDNNEKMWGQIRANNKIYSPQEAIEISPDIIVITVLNREGSVKIEAQLKDMGYKGQIFNINQLRDYIDIRLSALRLISDDIKEKNLPGEVAELGVYKGKFAAEINRLFPNKKIYLFDTFEGFSDKDIETEQSNGYSRAKQGDFSDTSIELVKSKLPYVDNATFVKGYFPESVTFELPEFCLVSLDTDLYEPTYEGLKVFYPKLVKGGVIIVHDYNSTQFSGVKKAVKRFCEEADVSVLPLSDMHGSAVLIK